MKATGILRLNSVLKGPREEQPRVERAAEHTMCHFVANCPQIVVPAIPAPAPYHTLPFLSALCFFAVYEQLLCNHTHWAAV